MTIAFAPGSLQVQLTTSITVLGQSISGTFGFQQTTSGGSSMILITASNVGICLGTNGCTGSWMGVQVTGGSAAVLITSAGAAGQISGGVTIKLGGSATVAATTATVSFNTSTTAVDQQYTLAGQTQTLSLPAGKFLQISAQGIQIALGGLTLTADVTFTDNAGAISVTVANAGLTISAGGSNVVVVSHGSGSFNSVSDGFDGSITATVAVNVPGVTIGGTFSVTFNTSASAQNSTPANTLEVTGTNITLGILGQTLTGSVGFEKSGDTVAITVTDLTLSLTAGGESLVTASIDSGALVITPKGIAAQLVATVTTGPLINSFLSVNGTFTLAINETNCEVDSSTPTDSPLCSEVVSLPSGSIDLQPGPFFQLGIGTPANPTTITLLGTQTISGVFFFEESTSESQGSVISLGFSDASICLGGTATGATCSSSTLVGVAGASGAIEITKAGVAGSISGNITIGGPLASIFSVNGQASVVFNSESTAVNDSLTYAPPGQGSVTLPINAPAGPFVAVQLGTPAQGSTPAQPFSASFGGFTMSGIFEFESIPGANGTTIEIGATDVSISTFSGLQGALIYEPANPSVPGSTAGIAGVLTVAVSAGSGSTGVSGNLGVEFNNTNAPINTTVTVGGNPIAVDIPALASPYFLAVAQGVTINLDNLVEIYGNFSVDPTTKSFAGNDMTLFVGSGPYETNGHVNPNAIGVLLGNASLDFKDESSGYALYATGTFALAGLGGLNVTATVTLEINTTGSMVTFIPCVTTTCSVPGTTNFSLTAQGVDINVANVLDISGSL